MVEINYKPIEDKLTELIKKKIREDGLVKSGKLINSISTKFDGTSFVIMAEDYYKYLDAEYNISQEVIESNEFTSFLEDYLAKEIEKQFK